MTTIELREKFESETGRDAVVINQYTYPTEQYFNWLEQELVKLFAIPDVSQRSELLKAFYAYVDDKWALGMLTNKVDEVIEGFEKSL